MQRRCVLRLMPWMTVGSCFVGMLWLPTTALASSVRSDSVFHCVVLKEEGWGGEDAQVAGKAAAEEPNVGKPRTVRMIYFLPKDRPYRQSVVDKMKTMMVRLQRLFGEQMEAHGYGYTTFRYEADASGAPVVHRLDGAHADRYYDERPSSKVQREVREAFDPNNVVLFVVIDNRWGDALGPFGAPGGIASGGKDGGDAIVPGGFEFWVAAHELAHAFGMLWHDHREGDYILGIYRGSERLSACSAAFLSVQPFFNTEVPLGWDWDASPTVELLSPLWYDEGSERITVRLKVEARHGLHQLVMLVSPPFANHFILRIKDCRVFSGENEAVIEYEYDGRISPHATTLSDPPSHFIQFKAIDKQGNKGDGRWTFAQRSPYHAATLEGHGEGRYVELALSADGSTLASGSTDGTVRLWDTKTYEELATLDVGDERIYAVALSPDGSTLAAGTASGWIGLWDAASQKRTGTLAGHTWWIQALAYSLDGATLVSSSFTDEDNMKTWDAATGEMTGVLKGHTRPVEHLQFSPDGSVLASASYDNSIRLWDWPARRVRGVLVRPGEEGIKRIALSPDGRTLAAASDVIAFWDVATRNTVAEMKMVHAPSVNVMAFSPDGETLASGGIEGTVIVRDAATGKIYARLPHTGSPKSLAYWHDGSVLAVGTTEGSIELWDTSEWVRQRPERVTLVSGDAQRGAAATALPAPFVVSVRDQHGDPFPGMPVLFSVTEGGGKVRPASAGADTSGNAATSLTLGPAAGMNIVQARAAGLAPAVFSAHSHGNPDINSDGRVDFSDFVVFAQKFGLGQGDDGYDARFDLNGDGEVGFSDFLILANAFGQSV